MRLAIASLIGLVTLLIAGLMFGPRQPHDYLRAFAKNESSKISFGKERNAKTGQVKFFEERHLELADVDEKTFDHVVDPQSWDDHVIIFNSVERDYWTLDENTTMFSMPTYFEGDSRPFVVADLKQYLQPREVWWVRMTHIGHEPF